MYPIADNLETFLVEGLDRGEIELDRLVVVEAAPAYPSELVFQPIKGAANLFYSRYRDWMSCYLVLSELYNLPAFVQQLEKDGYQVVFGPSCAPIFEAYQRWAVPLEVQGYDLHGFQQFSLNWAFGQRFFFFNWSTGAGKAEPITEPVLTPSGWRTMGDLHAGDRVIGSDGRPTRVIGVFPQGVRPVFRVQFNDGTFVRCDGEHLWAVRKNSSRTRRPTPSSPSRKPRIEIPPWKVLTTREIATNTGRRWQLPELPAVTYDPQLDPEIDPYVLGVFLGDGCWPQAGPVSVSTDRWIIESLGWTPWTSAEARGHDYHSVAPVPRAVRDVLQTMGLAKVKSADKFIPPSFLTASPAHRLALLQGLLDTDGCPDPRKSTIEYCSISLSLVEGVIDLVRGLGGKATVSGPRITRHQGGSGQPSWRVHLSLPVELPPFRLPRKLTNRVVASKYRPLKTIVSVAEEGVGEQQVCIVVDAPDSLYVTRGHTLTHNSFVQAPAAKELFARGDIDLVIACTTTRSKINLARFYEQAGMDVVTPEGTKEKRRRLYREMHQVYVLNYEKFWVDHALLALLCEGRRVLFCFDEVSKIVTADKQNKARWDFEKLIRRCHPASKVWPMSASVVNGNPLRFRDVFSLGGGLWDDNPLGSVRDFTARYADKVSTYDLLTPTGKRFPVTHIDWNLTRLQEVRHRVGDRTMVVRKTDPGIAHLFKELQTLVEPIQMSPGQRKIAEAIVEKAREAADRGETLKPFYDLLRYTAVTPLALRATNHDAGREIAVEFAETLDKVVNAKLERLNEQLAEIRDEGDQCLVFTHWTNLGLHLIKDAIEVPHVVHYGTGQTAQEAQQAQDRFKADPDITCFLTSDAGKEGLNMQCARTVIQLDPTYSYDDTYQRASRIHRADSHLDGLTNVVYVTEGSVEERVWKTNLAGRLINESIQGSVESLNFGSSLTWADRERAQRSEAENLAWMIFGRD